MNENPHITSEGEFRNGAYEWCPPGFVALKLTDPMAADLLARYALRRKEADEDFSNALLSRLFAEGYSFPKEFSDDRSSGVEMIAEERRRQSDGEGWSTKHDDEHVEGEIARAAATYLLSASAHVGRPLGSIEQSELMKGLLNIWPWSRDWFKPKTQLRDLVRAGALVAAEIDRLLRKRSDPQ